MAPMINGDTFESTPEARANEYGVGATTEVAAPRDAPDYDALGRSFSVDAPSRLQRKSSKSTPRSLRR